MSDQSSKLPRLYIDQPFNEDTPLSLEEGPAHYFRSVLRRQVGDSFRVFNGHDGEWIATITALGKKSGAAKRTEKIREQPPRPADRHLIFAPIKKQRMDFLIEKAVELGVTDLHPVLTRHTEMRKINEHRLEAQIIEALEQCERMYKPTLHTLEHLERKITGWKGPTPLYAALERQNAPALSAYPQAQSFLIGPEGGFAEAEVTTLMQNDKIQPISLGKTIYRAETACIICLAQAQNEKK